MVRIKNFDLLILKRKLVYILPVAKLINLKQNVHSFISTTSAIRKRSSH